jgi:hypothetical protein
MVIGESRFNEECTDRNIIEVLCDDGDLPSKRTFTKFMRALAGVNDTPHENTVSLFWANKIFYNYNTTFFPGKARKPLNWEERSNKQHQRALREMIAKYRPSHAIVWGKANWESIVVEGHDWAWHRYLKGPRQDCELCSVTIGSCRTLFTFIQHPSTAFSASEWHPLLKRFARL